MTKILELTLWSISKHKTTNFYKVLIFSVVYKGVKL